jgi:hypothetical protein
LESGSIEIVGIRRAASQRTLGTALIKKCAVLLLTAALLLPAISAAADPQESKTTSLPDAPQPQTPALATKPATAPCPATGTAQPGTQSAPCPPKPPKNWYERFLTGPEVKPMTPREKAHLAARNVIDPFNALTILGSSGIAVGANAHSPYGPGMTGFGRDVGVSYTEDITGQFFGVFLIPSIVHQDPHYHRMPTASIPHRVGHAIYQVVWTRGDNGKRMVNYGDVVGFAIDGEIGNFYVPGRRTNLPASAERYGITLALAPTENFITEFVPDVARRIHVRVVLIQRIINQVAKTGS